MPPGGLAGEALATALVAQEVAGLPVPIVLVVVGVVLLMIAAFAARTLRSRVTNVDDVEGSTGLVVIGAVPGKSLGQPVQSMNGQPLRPVDGLQEICRMLEHNGLGTAINVLTIVRAGARGPEATFATDLAHTLAAQGKNVLLVQANLRQPGGRAVMGLADDEGLADLLEDERIEPVTLLMSVAQRLLVLPAGTPRADPAVLLARPRLKQVIGSLRDLGFIAIIDAPPAAFARDVLSLAREADATLLIVRAGSRWKDVEEAARILRYGDVSDPAAVIVGSRW
jgi:succinoglycan biosynthesis transport protein ExoP